MVAIFDKVLKIETFVHANFIIYFFFQEGELYRFSSILNTLSPVAC